MSTLPFKTLSCGRGILRNMCNYRLLGPRNYWRRSGFSELSSAMQTFENRMRDMEREMGKVFHDVQRVSPFKLPRFFSPADFGCTREIPVVSTHDNGRTYRLELDVQGMEPEDINVTLKGNELKITARKEEKNTDGSRVIREQQYHYTLPDEVNLDTIRSSLTNGVLILEAQLPALESKDIKINIEKESKNDDPKTESKN